MDIIAIKDLLDYNVIEDIKQFNKPSLMYNYDHKNTKMNIWNTQDKWNIEEKKLFGKSLKLKYVNKIVEIDGVMWNVIIWVYQPLNKDGSVDEIRYNKMTNNMQCPLCMSIGYDVMGFCYLQFVDMV